MSLILTAKTVLTMDAERTRAQAVGVRDGIIAVVGTVEQCRAVLPDADIVESGAQALLPGFIEPHSHPVLSGMATMPPAYWVAPWFAPTWDDVTAAFRQAIAATPDGEPLAFFGFDGLLHQHPEPTAAELDAIFGDRMAVLFGNSGHTAYATTSVLRALGWIEHPPADPVGGSYGRHPDGSLNGRAVEVTAVMALGAPVLDAISRGPHPLQGAVEYYLLLASAGITSASEHTYRTALKPAYEAIASLPHAPVRISIYHMSTEPDCGDPFTSTAPEAMLRKQGIKLWADGSPWVGNIAMSAPYLDTPVTRAAGIPAGVPGEKMMNYTREQLAELLDRYAESGWQMAFHVNGDLGLDIVLDAFASALSKHGLTGTDHRWRVEHIGGARADQFPRMAQLGVVASLAPFQFSYWGDLLDGGMFAPEIGAPWQRFRDAFDAGVHPSFHNDGSVSPPTPLRNMQTAITRRTSSGALHGPEQAVTIDDALCAHTMNAAFALGVDHEVGSLEVGKRADFVALDADPTATAPERVAQISVLGTWLSGQRIDLEAFAAASRQIDQSAFATLRGYGIPCCGHQLGAHTA